MISFFNSHLMFYGGYTDMLKRYCVLAFDRALPWVRTPGAPFRVGPAVALVCLAISAFFGALAFMESVREHPYGMPKFQEMFRTLRHEK